MRIGIDLRFTAASCMGTGTYAETVALALSETRQEGDALIGFVEQHLGDSPLGRTVSQRPLSQRFGGSSPVDAQRWVFDAAIEREALDVFLAPTGIGPRIASCPVVVTIHDLLFERHPEYFGEGLLRYLRREVRRSVTCADLVIAVSAVTKREVHNLYGLSDDHVRVVHQPLRALMHSRPTPAAIAAAQAQCHVREPYLLTLTNHAPHKNSTLLLGIFARWIKQTGNTTHRLVIAGGGLAPQTPVDLGVIATQLGISERITITGRVPEEHLPGLLAGAAVFLFPSLHEGWGLPPVEALAMGTPVIVADRGGLPEAIGDAGIILPLGDESQWVTALATLVEMGPSSTLRQAMERRVRQLTESRGLELRECCTEAIERAGTAPPRSMSLPNQHTDSAGDGADRQSSSSPLPRGLSGCMIIRNGVRLGYPFVEAIQAVFDHVDEMVVVDGCSEDDTWTVLQEMASSSPKLRIHREPWPATSTGGHAIAGATNHALRLCRMSHILSIQADEIHTTSNLIRLRELLGQGFDAAAMPFLHFRSSWWTVLANPAYSATIRCIPNHPEVVSVDDGTTFRGPAGRCAPPDAFPDVIYHVGWVYAPNIVAKHQNHAALYADHAEYQEKARRASQLTQDADQAAVATIDGEYQLRRFQGQHPPVIAHLIDQPRYSCRDGVKNWHRHHAGETSLQVPGPPHNQHVSLR